MRFCAPERSVWDVFPGVGCGHEAALSALLEAAQPHLMECQSADQLLTTLAVRKLFACSRSSQRLACAEGPLEGCAEIPSLQAASWQCYLVCLYSACLRLAQLAHSTAAIEGIVQLFTRELDGILKCAGASPQYKGAHWSHSRCDDTSTHLGSTYLHIRGHYYDWYDRCVFFLSRAYIPVTWCWVTQKRLHLLLPHTDCFERVYEDEFWLIVNVKWLQCCQWSTSQISPISGLCRQMDSNRCSGEQT